MSGTRMRRIRRWLLPILGCIQIGLVLGGRVGLGTAVAIIIGIELLLALTAVGGVIAAARAFRAGRAEHRDFWRAAEDGLTELAPRRLARLVLHEVRLFAALARWITRGRDRAVGRTFSYHRGLAMMIWSGVVLVAVEGAVVEVLLAITLPHTAWPWIAFTVHAYGLLWLVGVYASMVIRPHLLTDDSLRIRDGIFTEVVIPRSALLGARSTTRSNFGRTGLKIDKSQQSGVLANGDANVVLSLDPVVAIEINGTQSDAALTSLTVSADDPKGLVRAIRTGEFAVT